MAEWTQWLDALPIGALAAIAFLAAFVETIPPIGLVIPGQTTIVTASFLAGRRQDGGITIGIAVTMGAIAGDLAGYALGRRTGLGFLGRLPRRLRPDAAKLAWLEQVFRSHGVKTVLVARFQPLTRCLAPLLAGASRMPTGRFVAASVSGAILASAMLVGGGYLVGLGFERVGRVLSGTVAVLGLVTLAAIALLVLRYRHARLDRKSEPLVRAAQFPGDLDGVRRLLRGYFDEFRPELGPQDFEGELERLAEYYRGPNVLLVAESDGALVGCAGLRAMGEDGEVKRMVVDPLWRGAGVGRRLGAAVVAEARQRGLRRLLLDTTPGMAAARGLYARLGFREVGSYYASPLPRPVFMELTL